MKATLKKLISRRAIRIYLGLGLCMATLIVLLYQIAKWRGAKAWNEAHTRLVQENEDLTLRQLTPDPVPAEQNFFGTPALAQIAGEGTEPDSPQASQRKRLVETHPGRSMDAVQLDRLLEPALSDTTLVDFSEWLAYADAAGTLKVDRSSSGSPAEQFLSALDASEGALFDELALAAERPHSQILPGFAELAEGGLFYEVALPHYGCLRELAKALALRSMAAAQSGDAKRARESIQIIMRAAQGLRADPALVATINAVDLEERCQRAIREGLLTGVFSDADLRALELGLGAVPIRDALLHSLRGELYAGLEVADWMKADGPGIMLNLQAESRRGVPSFLANLAPSGWLDQNRAYLARWHLDYLILPLRDRGLAAGCEEAEKLEQLLKQESEKSLLFRLHKILPMITLPAVSTLLEKLTESEAQRRIVLTACQLERYRMARGGFPDDLNELIPEFSEALENDPFSKGDAPLGYLKQGNGYRLFCAGREEETLWQFPNPEDS